MKKFIKKKWRHFRFWWKGHKGTLKQIYESSPPDIDYDKFKALLTDLHALASPNRSDGWPLQIKEKYKDIEGPRPGRSVGIPIVLETRRFLEEAGVTPDKDKIEEFLAAM
jgi:hypothetical protein